MADLRDDAVDHTSTAGGTSAWTLRAIYLVCTMKEDLCARRPPQGRAS
jgi:hypothetical protein